MWQTFVDRGGTFTDVVAMDGEGGVSVRKVPSDRAVVGALAKGALCFGTTVATNALLEGKGSSTLLVVTRGFRDLPWLGDGARPALFDSDKRWPEPLCHRVVEVGGRIGPAGEILEEIPPEDLEALRLLKRTEESVAVVLVHSPLNPIHELAVMKALGDRTPLSAGHQISPELGYLARIETTLVDAAITPILVAAMARDQIPVGALAMRSDGSTCPAEHLRAPDAVLSGPAGGVIAVSSVARMAGFDKAVGLDMGGTSTDVCRVEAGSLPRREGESRVAGLRLCRPVLEVETIAAGGGSILSSDGLRLSVGPESAGAHPGPACYGRGGPPTLTDAALVAGLVDPQAFDPPLDPSAVVLPGKAEDFLDIARESMAAAVKRLATARGVDLTDHALVAYGGAAGQHAAEVAGLLGIETVLFHPCAAVLCAWGQALARREESAVTPLWQPLEEAWGKVEAAWRQMESAFPEMGAEAVCLRSLELRHRGTDHAIEVAAETVEAALALFEREHLRRYGFSRKGQVVEVVNARLRIQSPVPEPPAITLDPWGLGTTVLEGPRRISTPHTSIQVPEGWVAFRREGLLVLQCRVPRPRPDPEERSAYGVELWSSRFMAVAQQAGEVLRRLARSVNIRERRDFSVAIFDAQGGLVANAPHIPVHLGAMGETVRDLLAHVPDLNSGGAWLSNDPQAGGSHLPDLTVVTPVTQGEHMWFVASRAHHVDVGGTSPGSMPPDSTRLEDEGAVLSRIPLLRGDRLVVPEALVEASREPECVRADLEAQVAANLHAAQGLLGLGEPALVEAWMGHLQEVARMSVLEVLDCLQEGEASDEVDGLALRLSLSVDSEELHVDLAGTEGPHPGNLNTPRAVVRAAVLYALRCLVGRDIPLNEGALLPVRIHLPSPSLVDPPPSAAVVGGNVESSQRIVDLFFAAAGVRAGSQGTMNNLTLGGRGWSFYETVAGGLGASSAAPGVDGRQVHMTNTRATDVEVLEARLPLRVRKFSLREDSGGRGHFRGGRGVVREIEVLEECSAALLATRRDRGASGLSGGGAGAPGADWTCIDGKWASWSGAPVALRPGDRVRLETPGGGGWGEGSLT